MDILVFDDDKKCVQTFGHIDPWTKSKYIAETLIWIHGGADFTSPYLGKTWLSFSLTSSRTYQIISHLTKLKTTRVLRDFSRFAKVVSIPLSLQTKTLLLQPYLFNHLTFLDIASQIRQALLLLHWAQNDWIHSKQANEPVPTNAPRISRWLKDDFGFISNRDLMQHEQADQSKPPDWLDLQRCRTPGRIEITCSSAKKSTHRLSS